MTAVPETPPIEDPKPSFLMRHKWWFIAGGLVLLTHLSLYLYQRHLRKEVIRASNELIARNHDALDAITLERSQEIATNLCRTLVFGIRGEMERGNKAEIDLFLNKMVQESGLDLIIIQDAQDSIYLSTDKQYENHKVPYIQGVVTEQQVLRADLGEVVIAAPVMGQERRLGTCLVVYSPTRESLDLVDAMKRDSLRIE